MRLDLRVKAIFVRPSSVMRCSTVHSSMPAFYYAPTAEMAARMAIIMRDRNGHQELFKIWGAFQLVPSLCSAFAQHVHHIQNSLQPSIDCGSYRPKELVLASAASALLSCAQPVLAHTSQQHRLLHDRPLQRHARSCNPGTHTILAGANIEEWTTTTAAGTLQHWL